jgi:hypothetical protein
MVPVPIPPVVLEVSNTGGNSKEAVPEQVVVQLALIRTTLQVLPLQYRYYGTSTVQYQYRYYSTNTSSTTSSTALTVSLNNPAGPPHVGW